MQFVTASTTIVPSKKQAQAALRVLDTLERWDTRFQKHHARNRAHVRKPYRTIVTLYTGKAHPLPKDDQLLRSSDVTEQKPERYCYERCYKAWTRNVSQGGMAFVFPARLPEQAFVVELDLGQKQNAYFRAVLCRVREVHHGFWEHGVAFQQRLFVPSDGQRNEQAVCHSNAPGEASVSG